RVRTAQHDELADLLQLADRAQPSHAIRRGELLAAEAGDETAAANLAPRLQAAIDAHQVAPRGELRLALEHRAEDDAVALEEEAGDVLEGLGLGLRGIR